MNTTNSASLQVFSLGQRAAQWAANCVEALADALAGSVTPAKSCQTMIVAEDGRMTIAARDSSGNWKPAVTVNGLGEASLPVVRKQLDQGARGPVLLRTGTGRAVTSRLQLPAAAKDVLPAVVRNKVESLAPWPLHEALWGYRQAARPENGQIAVDVGIVSRKSALALLGALETAGIRVSRFEISRDSTNDDGIEIDVYGELRKKRSRRRITAALLSFAGIAAVVGGYGAYVAYSTSRDLSAIDEGLSQIQQSLRGNSNEGVQSAKLAAANKLYVRKAESRPVLDVLNTLSTLLPDGIWLTTLELDGTEIKISGRGNEVPGVIETLESSNVFRDVNFAAATQREPDAAIDSFSISAIVEAEGIQP